MIDQPHLLAAEVDKIQSFIFRSSTLKEVIGGSHLLEKFCNEVQKRVVDGVRPVEVVSSAGGSFRLVFASHADAKSAGKALRQAFQRSIGGTITIAEPVPYRQTAESLRAASAELRKAKTGGRPPAPVWHIPYHAICASCGLEAASFYGKLDANPGTREKYICESCKRKADTTQEGRAVFEAVLDQLKTEWGYDVPLYEAATSADTYAKGWDERGYVAYLVADGNGMGVLFNGCEPDAFKRLSQSVGVTAQAAFVKAIAGMKHHSGGHMPALPLLLGGDDLFALIPAPWSFDVAQQYCVCYQEMMTDKLREIGVLTGDTPATTGAAIVICKASYPHRNAHQAAHELLDAVKQESKEQNTSMFAVQMIGGTDTVFDRPAHTAVIHVPYSPSEHPTLSYRYALKDIASRTLEAAREALTVGRKIDPIIARMQQMGKASHADQLQTAYDDLGSKYLLELLELWDFTLNLNRNKAEYTPELN